MTRYGFFFAVVFLLSSFSAFAEVSPQDLVQSTADKTIAKVKAEKAAIEKDPTKLVSLVNEYVLPHFDFDRMSKWVMGKHWQKMTPEQRKRFVTEFRNLLVRTYVTSLMDYADQKINYSPFRGDLASGDVTVRSEVSQPGGFPVPINYRLSNETGDWKVYDVTIDDVSLIANYRTSFGNEVRTVGVDALLEKMATRNEKGTTK